MICNNCALMSVLLWIHIKCLILFNLQPVSCLRDWSLQMASNRMWWCTPLHTSRLASRPHIYLRISGKISDRVKHLLTFSTILDPWSSADTILMTGAQAWPYLMACPASRQTLSLALQSFQVSAGRPTRCLVTRAGTKSACCQEDDLILSDVLYFIQYYI